MSSGNPAKRPGKYGAQMDTNEEHVTNRYAICPLESGYEVINVSAVNMFRTYRYRNMFIAFAMKIA
jgi:hypothetical protein